MSRVSPRLARYARIMAVALATLGALPHSGGKTVSRAPPPGSRRNLEVIQADIRQVWDKARFLLSRLPYPVTRLPARERRWAVEPKPQFNNMLIQEPGGALRLPTDDPVIRTFVERSLAFERRQLPGFERDYYLYLTVHQKWVMPGKSQRTAGAHIDGMQGARYPEKFPIDHLYVMTTARPTASYPQAFDVRHLSESADNFFAAFQRQIQQRGDRPRFGRPFTIELMSGYQVHESPIVEEPVLRTFYRLDVTRKRFDDERDSENPLLVRRWRVQDRAVPEALRRQETLFASRAGSVGHRIRGEGGMADAAALDELRRNAREGEALGAFLGPAVRGAGRTVTLGHDEAGRSRQDPETKFILIRDRKAIPSLGREARPRLPIELLAREHVVAVATPDPRSYQPVHLHDVVDLPGPRRHLGRMIRAALLAGERLHGPEASRTWQAAISLPDSVSMPALHVNAHNIGRPFALAAQDRPWLREVQRAPYAPTMEWRRVGPARYRVWVDRDAGQTKEGFPVVATATDLRGRPLAPEALKDSRYDELVGKMFLDVYRVCQAHGLRHGQIELDRRGAELVVKAHVWPREEDR